MPNYLVMLVYLLRELDFAKFLLHADLLAALSTCRDARTEMHVGSTNRVLEENISPVEFVTEYTNLYLIYSINDSDLNKMMFFVETFASLSKNVSENSAYMIECAVVAGNLKFMKHLVENYEIDTNIVRCALEYAVSLKDRYEIVMYLLSEFHTTEGVIPISYMVFWNAAARGYIEFMDESLRAHGKCASGIYQRDFHALDWALNHRCLPSVKYLVETLKLYKPKHKQTYTRALRFTQAHADMKEFTEYLESARTRTRVT